MSDWDFISDPDVAAHTGFVLAEEAALKQYLSGLQVPNPRGEEGASEVPVWFRWPESERRMSYPFITIDTLTIAPAYDRWTSVYNAAQSPVWFDGVGDNPGRWGLYYPGYTPEIEVEEGKTYYVERYLPYNIVFQVSTFCRSALHDRYLTSRFMTDVFGPRSFAIDVDADHAWRRCELVQWANNDTMETTEASKRIFRKFYTVLMETEIPTSRVIEYGKINSVHVDIYDLADNAREGVGHAADGPHDTAVDHFTTTGEVPV